MNKIFGYLSCTAVLALPGFVVANEAQDLELGSYIGRIYQDGSGAIGQRFDPATLESCQTFSCKHRRSNATATTMVGDYWSFQVKTDEMTDHRMIILSRRHHIISKEFGEMQPNSNIYLWLVLSSKARERVCVGGHDFPGKKAKIRVDSLPALTTNTEGCVPLTNQLYSQMSSGTTLTVRGYHWPYDAPETREIKLGGFKESVDFLRRKQ